MEANQTDGLILALLIGVIVVSVTVSYTVTDTIMGATTSAVNSIVALGYVAFTIAGVGVIAVVGRNIIEIFN